MSTQNLALVVGSYADTESATEDYRSLRSGQDAGGYEVIGAVVLVRGRDGKVQVKEHGDKSVGTERDFSMSRSVLMTTRVATGSRTQSVTPSDLVPLSSRCV